MALKILVIHSTSLVGKSTTVASLLHPRLRNPRIFSVEKQNQDASRYGIEVVRYNGPDFRTLFDDIVAYPSDLIVDVGASQYSGVIKEFARLAGSIDDFDIVLVPTTPDGRVQEETLGTIDTLRKVGMNLEKLRVLFNRATIDDPSQLDEQFEPVIAYLQEHLGLSFYKDLILYENPIHSELRAEGLSFEEVARDTTNYREKVTEAVRKSPRSAETQALIRMLGLQRAVNSARIAFDEAFQALRLPVVTHPSVAIEE
ncbi:MULTISPECIES: hypothetical protein [unclassified Paraburkholderia]|uniref:hypothetical protein n=1 Tax=unclassified Paraburkholderia TaxID=2615204 RepID=UPI002AB01C11|nr:MULTISPECIES: hypothetical protein [unclassified Paraburkholderia]